MIKKFIYLTAITLCVNLTISGVHACTSPVYALTETEARIMMITEISPWFKKPFIMDSLHTVYSSYSRINDNDIKSLQDDWYYDANNMKTDILENSISTYFRKKVEESDNRFQGIFLLDYMGFVMASSFELADYNHKDKPYYLQTYKMGSGILYLTKQDDDSVITFAHTIDRNGKPIGTLVILLNPEKFGIVGKKTVKDDDEYEQQ